MALIGIIIGGLIVQWGRVNISSQGTVTLPTSFTSSYGITSNIYDANYDANTNCYDLTTTNFKIKIEGGGRLNISWIAVGY